MTQYRPSHDVASHSGEKLASSTLALAAMQLTQDIGWAIFPCRPRDKMPLIAQRAGGSGCHDATTHAEQIGHWWERWPAANIGIATGGRSGLFVVDVDGPRGEEALAAFGEIPATVEARTGKGRHLYFRATTDVARNSVGMLAAQIDTRGQGGYVIAPPSIHPNGFQYAWRENHSPSDLPPTELPDAICRAMHAVADAKLTNRPTIANATSRNGAELKRFRNWLERVPSGLSAGDGRNAIAFRIATRALQTLSVSDARQLVEAWNSGNAEPLHAREVRRILHSAQRYGCRYAA